MNVVPISYWWLADDGYCPKCGYNCCNEHDIVYCRTYPDGVLREHLLVSCVRCGYSIERKCLDAEAGGTALRPDGDYEAIPR